MANFAKTTKAEKITIAILIIVLVGLLIGLFVRDNGLSSHTSPTNHLTPPETVSK